MLLAVKLMVLPAHTGPLAPATGAAGVALIVAAVVDCAVQPPISTVTV